MSVLNKGTAKDPALAYLLHCLSFFLALRDISLSAVHVASSTNVAADALSHNDLPTFFLSLPQADKAPSPIPADLLKLILLEQPDWTAPRWRELFKNITARA